MRWYTIRRTSISQHCLLRHLPVPFCCCVEQTLTFVSNSAWWTVDGTLYGDLSLEGNLSSTLCFDNEGATSSSAARATWRNVYPNHRHGTALVVRL